jgi:SagB-type dehydrogenase family enzyme
VPHKIEAHHQPVPDAISSQVLTGLKEREEFKERCLNLRQVYDTDIVIPLSFQDQLEQFAEIYERRRSHRIFRGKPVPFERFSEFFKSLRYLNADGKPKYQYASAGGIYPLQVYLHVKPERVENVPGGAYYYYPVTHELVYLSGDEIGVNCHWPMNHEAFQNSAFSIFLVAEMASITPLYGKLSRDFCLLEAGMMMQLMEIAGTKYEIGLCQIGSLDFDHLRPMFRLKESQVLLHSAVSGSVTPLAREMRFELPDYHRIAQAHQHAHENEHLLAAVDGARLREYLQQVLPAHLIPTQWIMLDALPLSANGKVDRKALPPPEELSPAVAAFVAPSNEMERKIAAAIADELKIERVGLGENFFELGATSINLVRINTRLRNEEIVFPIVELFQYPTVAALSMRLASGKQADASVQGEEQERARKQRRARARHDQSSLSKNPSEVQ